MVRSRRLARERVSRTMREVRSSHTTPELIFRRALWRAKCRFRLHQPNLPGKPDLVFPGDRLAIFVDGDFWHGNQWARRGFGSIEEQMTRVHRANYWITKIERNRLRDFRNSAALQNAGWSVMRFWESDLSTDLDACVDKVIAARRLLSRGGAPDLFSLLPTLRYEVEPTENHLAKCPLRTDVWTNVVGEDAPIASVAVRVIKAFSAKTRWSELLRPSAPILVISATASEAQSEDNERKWVRAFERRAARGSRCFDYRRIVMAGDSPGSMCVFLAWPTDCDSGSVIQQPLPTPPLPEVFPNETDGWHWLDRYLLLPLAARLLRGRLLWPVKAP